MEKIKILGISKNKHRSLYSFPKEQKLFGIIREILYKLNFKDSPLDEIRGFGRPFDQKSENVIMDKEENIMSKDYYERITNFYNKEYSIDVIFFSKKVVLILNYTKNKQQEISKVIENFIIGKK